MVHAGTRNFYLDVYIHYSMRRNWIHLHGQTALIERSGRVAGKEGAMRVEEGR